MKLWLKRLFCWHDWQLLGARINDNNVDVDIECSKCGKREVV